MKSVYLIITVLLILNCSPKKIESVRGVYINCNYNYEPFIAEIPYVKDTLILNINNTFESKYFGKGQYKLEEDKIRLSYPYQFGTATFEAEVELKNKSIDKIILFKDQNHHYKKLK